ncbi:MAG: YraN family protein [Clostridiales bacterium]|nr:YraN family protein [Clostridiales bacterium]
MNNRERGAKGETLALAYMKKQGYVLLARNFRAARCEVDLILKKEGMIVFAEVKARSGSSYGLGREAVTGAKQHNIITAAQVYLSEKGLFESDIRFDVLEVDLLTGEVGHIPSAFTL